MPCWLTAKVLTPVSPYFAGQAMRPKPRDHVAVDDVVVGAAGDVVALAGEDLVLVAEIALALRGIIEFGLAEVAGRALAVDVVGRPVDAVGRAFRADQLLREFLDAVPVAVLEA